MSENNSIVITNLILLNGETPTRMVDAYEQLLGYRPHVCIPRRHASKKSRYGNQLETVMIGGYRMTSVAAVKRYFQAETNAADRNSNSPKLSHSLSRSESARKKQIKRADKALEAAGI